jgi:hypothetical protein
MKAVLLLIAVMSAGVASAQVKNDSIQIEREALGSGQPYAQGMETAQRVGDNDYFHAPQYMPGYPTAATIYPRVVRVACQSPAECEGYHWTPGLGRGEYLFVEPELVQVAAPPPEEPAPPPPRMIDKPIRQ